MTPRETKRRPWDAESIKLLTQTELQRLFACIRKASRRDYAIFLVSYRHGLRSSDVGLHQVSDLDVTGRKLRIHRCKKSRGGIHPLRPDEFKAIRAMLRERTFDSPVLFASRRRDPISRRQLDNLMKLYGQAAALPEEKRHFHVLKHSICTHLLEADADLYFVNDWVGHASISNTMIYTHLTSRRRDERARQVFARPEVV